MVKEEDSRKEKILKELELPDGVNAHFDGEYLLVKGPKGETRRIVKLYLISINIAAKKIVVKYDGGKKEGKKMAETLIAHIKNMVKGSLQNHVYVLKICSGHFPMNVSISNSKLIVKNFLGEKVPRILNLKQGADVRVEGDLIYVTSANKEIAGQVSADIEQLTRRPGYDSRVFQDGCYIVSKDGKEIK